MMDEPLERCICTGLAGFVFQDRPAGGRRVAVSCATCGTRTQDFTLDRIEDAVMAWEAGDFADGSPTNYAEVPMARSRPTGQPRSVIPAKLRS